ncbi:MAG: bifunctional helix-turn-helix transcriptional regulator/GNAT family N-acetyltransferase [Planctomycetota bacterium]|jgi:ribosomal protein S18 acetylase RimI-like enzyme/DNA-binding transcriptional ArsR family regulator
MNENADLIKELGELGFATRLKRLSERLMKDVSRIYGTLDVEFEARWFALLYGLSKRSPMPVTALAQALGLTHTAVNQLAAEMMKKNLLRSTRDKKDDRKRLLSLSKKGRQVAVSLAAVWREIRSATKELIDKSGNDILAGIDKIEAQLDEQDMYERVLKRMNIQPAETIEIVDYRPAYKKHFMALNRRWLEEHFTMEKPDQAILTDPNGRIIRKGGAILFALRDGETVGTCALVKLGEKDYELTKMAVAPHAQGRGIGTMLARAVIERARDLGAKALYLETSPKLKPAILLYEKLGFKKINDRPPGAHVFKRRTITMRRKLSKKGIRT